MITNFEIEHNYAVRKNGRIYDLHNNFDLVSFNYEASTREFKIIWKRSKGNWVRSDDPGTLMIIHKDVSFLNISEIESEANDSNDTCLRDFTFFPSTHRDMNDSVSNAEKPSPGDDIIYFLENDQVIRIGCLVAEIII